MTRIGYSHHLLGPYTTIELRRLGPLQPFQTLTALKAVSFCPSSPTFPRAVGNPPFPAGTTRRPHRQTRVSPEGVFAVRLTPSRFSPFIPDPGTFVALRLLYDATNPRDTGQRVEALGYLPEQQQLLRRFTERSGLSIAGATDMASLHLLKHIMEGMAENPTRNTHDAGRSGEYVIRRDKAAQRHHQHECGKRQKMEMVNANAGLMRSDPDVIMIGEIQRGQHRAGFRRH